MKINKETRKKLKKPLGEVYTDLRILTRKIKGKRVITVGDITTLSLLAVGIKPHLAVFDFRFMRTNLADVLTGALRTYYPSPTHVKNRKGHLSESLLKDARGYMKKGGAIFVEGEEDLTALAFILASGKKDVVLYGQPETGIVLVKYDEELKNRIRRWLSAAALFHKVK